MKPEDLKIEGHDFGRLTRRLEALNFEDVEMDTAGFVDGFPIYCIRLGGDPRGRKPVLLSGGVHGDEPAGTEAVLAFLERTRRTCSGTLRFSFCRASIPTGTSTTAGKTGRAKTSTGLSRRPEFARAKSSGGY